MNPVNKPPAFFSIRGKELRFDVMADIAPGLMWVCDLGKHAHFLNRNWHEFTGGSPASDLGEKWLNQLQADDRLKFTLDFDLARSAETGFAFRFRLKNHTGDFRWVSGSANPLYDDKGNFAGYIGFCIDVHDLKASQLDLEQQVISRTSELQKKNETLFAQNRFVETILDSTVSMITVVDKDLRYITFNAKAEEYTGLKRDQVIGKNMFDVFPYLRQTEVEENVHKAFEDQIVHVSPKESVLQKGKFFETFYLPLKTSSSHVHAVIIKVHDRTEQMLTAGKIIESNKKLEDKNRELQRQAKFIETLFDSIVDIIAVLDTNYHYISINKTVSEKYNLSKEQIIGKHIISLFPSVEDSDLYRDLKKAMAGEFVYDLSYTSKIINDRTFQNYYIPLTDTSGKVYAVMIIGHDITDLVKANDNLQTSNDVMAQKNKELERSNQELEQFAYVASHDLQEPIRKIATYTNKLLTHSKDNFNEETTTYLKRINNATNRMYELINGLLLYSRVTRHGNLFVATQLNEVLRQVLVDFELRITQKKAVIQYNRLPELEAVPVQMNQMFSNLISNSLKFAKADVTPVIQVSSSDLTQEQKEFYKLNTRERYVNIFYLDNGIGFEQQYAEKIFELFQRLHHRHLYEGSGIGLSICKKIVSNHNGLIYAFSEPDKGVTFQIILPYSQKSFS
jgi:PAS domain S-box-containing protein